MQLVVSETIQMRSLRKEDAPAVFAAVDENRTYLRQWLPWVDETNSPDVIEKVISDWEVEEENGINFVMGLHKFIDVNYNGNNEV